MALIMAMFGTCASLLLNVTWDRVNCFRECTTKHYSVMAYCASKFVVEAFLTFSQILFESVLYYNLMGLQMNYFTWFLTLYSLALVSSAIAVWIGYATDNHKTVQETLPILFVPQILFLYPH